MNQDLVFFRISNEQDAVYQAGISIPYSEEYKIQQPEYRILEMITSRTDGKILTEPSEAFREMDLTSSEKQSIQQMSNIVSYLLVLYRYNNKKIWISTLMLSPFKKLVKKRSQSNTTTTSNVGKLVKRKEKTIRIRLKKAVITEAYFAH